MKTNKLFLMLLTCFFASSVSATIHTVNAGFPYYSPSSLNINVGDTVEWVNDGGTHDVNANINSQTVMSFNNPVSFQSPITSITNAIIHTQIFTLPGVYNYDCSVYGHASAGMVGSITVTPSNTIYDIVSNSPTHNFLKICLDTTSLDAVFSDLNQDLTLFAPSDDAFLALAPGTVAALLADLTLLTDILKHHAVQGTALAASLTNNLVVQTLLGTDVTVTTNSTGVFIDNAQVTFADIIADNGVVHVINAILLPPMDCNGVIDGIASLDTCGTCHESYMYSGMGTLNYVSTYADTVGLGGIFILAGSVMDQQANPNWINDPALCANSIYDIVSASAVHTTLKAAIDVCALDGILSNPGSFTLFAPTNAAFDLLPPGTVADLLANDIPGLTDILKHHVVGDSVMSGMLSNNLVVPTLNGDVLVTINSMVEVFIDNAQVIVADLIADNGVVHVIDAVLLPTTTSVSELNHLDKEYVYSVNILGERVSDKLKNQIIFNVFKDGSVEKVFNK